MVTEDSFRCMGEGAVADIMEQRRPQQSVLVQRPKILAMALPEMCKTLCHQMHHTEAADV